MKKLILLAAVAVGYVLGAKAGRSRYEQIRSTFTTVKDDPRVQQAAATAASTAKEQAPVVANKVTDLAATAKDKAAAAAPGNDTGSGSKGPDGASVDELHPDSTARQEDPYPQGDLP